MTIDYTRITMRYCPRILLQDSPRIDALAWRESDKPELRMRLRECEVCVLVYSCANRFYFELLVQVWD